MLHIESVFRVIFFSFLKWGPQLCVLHDQECAAFPLPRAVIFSSSVYKTLLFSVNHTARMVLC